MRSAALVGNGAALSAAVLFGASVVATRIAVREIPPLSLAVLRFGAGGALLLLCLLAVAPGLLRVAWRDVPFLLLLGAILFSVFPLTFNAGLQLTPASRGALMLATMPLWSAVLAHATRRERLRVRQVGGIVLTFVGVGIVLAEQDLTWEATGRMLAGDGLMLLTAVCGAVYSVLAPRALSRYRAVTVTAYAMVLGTLLLLPAAIGEGLLGIVARLDETAIVLVLFLGIVGGALGYSLITFALTRLTPTQVVVYINFNPIVAAVFAAILLDERLTEAFVAGLGAVIGGVLLVNWPARRAPGPEGLAVFPVGDA